ncbi:MAG: hypothetical protein HY774_26030 [Acidobacteria bacterium]|nr:hypothetical protein [Acidobacteriota bacterium]
MSESFNRAKCAPARPHPRAFHRAYLSNLLSSHFDVPLVLIEAPRGYGKTTLLASMAHRVGANVRWLTLDARDRDLNHCVQSLCSSLYNVQMGAGQTTVSSTSQAARLIVSALKELSIDTLILDNYETVIGSDSVNALIEQIVSELPPLNQIVVASQKAPPFKRAARIRSKVMELNPSDLRFDSDDVAGYFDTIARYRLTPTEASLIVQRTEGQPVTINLLSQLAYGLQSYLRINFDALPLSPGEQTLLYLLREVLNRLPFPLEEAGALLSNYQKSLQPPPPASEDEDTPAPPTAEEAQAAATPLLEKLAAHYCLVHEHETEPMTLIPHSLLVDFGNVL